MSLPGYVCRVLPVLACCLLWQACPAGEEIRNPYHEQRLWRLWSLEDTPLVYRYRDRQIRVQLPPVERRLYPDDAAGGLFLSYRNRDWKDRKYAGFWDDVYQTLDNGHSRIREEWDDGRGNHVTLRDAMITLETGPDPRRFGVNFTSKSHAGQGAPMTDRAVNVLQTERDYYFQNIVRAAPAHKSFLDGLPGYADDEYQALVPGYFNSIGASGSETMALTKMVIAGGYLPTGTKRLLKEHGLYPSALLYLWKAALPYDVPYASEMRHLPAYFSAGDNHDTRLFADRLNHHYDEPRHLAKMVDLAKSMTEPPPLAILKTLTLTGGTMIYALKTAILVRQAPGEDVRLRVSAEDSFDLLDRPLSFRLAVLHGNRRTRIEADPDGHTFTISVPDDPQLPRGRTSILLIADNGRFDSNPAIINIYRTGGDSPDWRPGLTGLEERNILPGETVNAVLESEDPEGQPVRFYRWLGDEGELDGNHFRWRSAATEPVGDRVFHFTASDGTGRSGFTSANLTVHVRETIASVTCDRQEGVVPLQIRCDGGPSRAAGDAPLGYSWDFDDGATGSGESVSHTFTTPGFYLVKLTVRSRYGTHAQTVLIHAQPAWRLAVDNGWGSAGPDPLTWRLTSPETPLDLAQSTGTRLIIHGKDAAPDTAAGAVKYGLETVREFTPPVYLEARFRYVLNDGRRIEVFGHRIGDLPRPGPADYGTPLSIGYGEGAESTDWQTAFIGSTRASYGLLRLYVTADPRNPGRYRFRGTLQAGGRVLPIRFDDRELPDRRLGFYTQTPSSLFEVFRFQLWTPDGDIGHPDLHISGADADDYYVPPGLLRADTGGLRFRPAGDARSVTHVFTLENRGGGELRLQGAAPYLAVSGGDAADFRVSRAPARVIPAGSATDFAITFNPSGPGERSTSLTVNSNDPDEPRARIRLYGRDASRARLVVEGNGLFLDSGDRRPGRADATDFRRSRIGTGSGEHVFLLHNTGNTDLLLELPVRMTGAHAGDFQITKQPRRRIGPRESSTLALRFIPSEPGPRSARLTLHSNAADNGEFLIHVQGTGVADSASGTGSAVAAGSQ